MQISEGNIGDIICLADGSGAVQVELVADGLITFRTEAGDSCAIFEREVDGFVVTDPLRIRQFSDNYELGAALFAAEMKAKGVILDWREGELSRQNALEVLEQVFKQQKHLKHCIEGHGEPRSQKKASLETAIANAKGKFANSNSPDGKQSIYLPER